MDGSVGRSRIGNCRLYLFCQQRKSWRGKAFSGQIQNQGSQSFQKMINLIILGKYYNQQSSQIQSIYILFSYRFRPLLYLADNIMDRQALLSQLQLRSLQLVQSSPSARKPLPSQRAPNSTRTLVKLYLTKEILQECLQSLDIFRELLDDPIQRSKLLRDVGKNIVLKQYDEGAVVYERGEIATSLFMVIKGEVSLCLPGDKQTQGQQIDACREGMGFGQAEFVHGRKRALVAKARIGETIVGVLQAQAFEEVIQLYRQRVYLRKVEMFGNCPLLHQLQPYQLQFIVHNAKPVTFPIGKEVISKEEPARTVFLITEGALQLRTDAPKSGPSPQLMKYRTNSKAKLEDVLKDKIKLKRLVVGTVQEGQFLGDCQLALSIPHTFSAIVKTARVRAYACDERIILSQMTPQLLSAASKHYRQKQRIREDKPQAYQQAKTHLQRRLDAQQPARLTPLQQRSKRIIISRYVEPVPSALGRLSPKEISRIIQKKCARMRTQPIAEVCLPVLSVSPQKRLEVDQRAYSPLLRQERSGAKKSSVMHTPQRYLHAELQSEGAERSQTRPKLVFMRPFVKKVLSLHERLTKQYNQQPKGLNRQANYSVIEMRRMGSGLS